MSRPDPSASDPSASLSLHGVCNDLDIRASIGAVPRRDAVLFPSPITILGFDKTDDAAVWAEFSGKIRGTQIVKVYLADGDGEEPVDFLPEKEATISITVRRECPADFQRLKEALEAILPD